MTFKVASFKFSPNTPLSPWLNINFFTHQYFGFFSGTEARTNILTISDLAWQSVTYSSILSSWQKVIYPQIRNSDSHTKVLWNPLWKENSWIQYLQIGPELLKLFRDLTFTFSQPFNNLHCYFFGGGFHFKWLLSNSMSPSCQSFSDWFKAWQAVFRIARFKAFSCPIIIIMSCSCPHEVINCACNYWDTLYVIYKDIIIIITIYYIFQYIIHYKVNRYPARYSPRATTTNQPTNRAPNKLARPICAKESIFWDKNGRFWAKHPNHFGKEQKFW